MTQRTFVLVELFQKFLQRQPASQSHAPDSIHMTKVVFGGLQSLNVLKGMLQTVELDDSVLVLGRSTSCFFQCFAYLSNEVCRHKDVSKGAVKCWILVTH